MPPNRERWARFGPPNPRLFVHVPRGGVCLSAFLVVRDARGAVLLGRPRMHPAWPTRGCLPLWRVREIRREEEWILPASHLMMGEDPGQAARRIAREWAGFPGAAPRFVRVDSGQFPVAVPRGPGRRPGRASHWTLCFLYELRAPRAPGASPKWEERRFFSPEELRNLKIGRLHRDLLRDID